MSESTASANSCPKCGAALPLTATAGLCPRCLMAEAMAPTQVDAEPAATQPTLAPEDLAPFFPQLEILECLGRGGMGVVYKARQKTLNRIVALKLLAPERVRDTQFAERFTREAQALAALNHPNIVTIYDFGPAGGFYFLLMEFVDGLNLRQLLRMRKFTPEEALAIVPPLCDALQRAHDRGIVHRDIKPENLLLDKEGRVKVADFGIAKMMGAADAGKGGEGAAPGTTTQTSVGTPGYSAPEQKNDPQRVDSRADIYSLGVVFYEMLTGELPGKRIEPPSAKVQIDVRLDAVVLRALEQKPELRFQQISEVKTMVETIVRSAAAPSTGTPGKAFDEASSVARGARALPEPRFSKATIVIGVAVVFAAITATVAVKATFFPAPPDSYFQADYQHFQRLPSGLFIFRPTHFHTPLNGLDYSCEAQSMSGEHLTWMMGRNRTFVQFVTRLYNCVSNQVVWPADMPEGRFDYLYTMLDSKTGERFGAAVRKELGLELVPTNLPGKVLVVEKAADDTRVIVEGKGWGGFNVGATREELIKALGQPDNDSENRWMKWEQTHVDCLVDDAHGAFELRFNEGFSGHTTAGIGIGFHLKDALAAYGEPSSQENVGSAKKVLWTSKGILIWFHEDKAAQIVVFQKTEEPTVTPPAGPVELKWKWPPVGERVVFDVEIKRNGEYLYPGQPVRQQEDRTLEKKYGLTVLQATPGGGHEVELEFVNIRDRIALGGNSMLDYDSTQKTSASRTNSLADLYGKVVGSKIRYFLNASNEVERMEGADELEQQLSSGASAGASAFSRIQFNEDNLKQLVTGLFRILPPKVVQPGDTWPFQTEMAMGSLGRVSIDHKVTFRNWEQHWKRNCARLEFQSTMKTKPEPDSNPADTSVSSFEGASSGVAWFDPELGMVIEAAANTDMKMVIDNIPTNSSGNPGASGLPPGTIYQTHDSDNATILQHYVLGGGIGVELRVDGENIVVQEIVPGMPAAAQQDIHVGDRIIAVAQGTGPAVPVHGGQLAQAVALMRGPAGTTVRLTLASPGEDDSHARVVSFVRAELKTPPR